MINGFIVTLSHLSYLMMINLLMITIHFQMQFFLQEIKKKQLYILGTIVILYGHILNL